MRQLMQESCKHHLMQWEKIEHDAANGWHTYRAPVPGGWLMRLINQNSHPIDTDYIFIADKNHSWSEKVEEKDDKNNPQKEK